MAKLVIRHDLHTLDAAQLKQYLRDVSEHIGIDPDLDALDAIWMPNESGNGQSLVVYARRGTAEILRNKLGIDVDSLTSEVIDGSIVFTAKGHNTHPDTGRPLRTEVAIGSKYIRGIEGKAKDDAIMTASTRALRRLTMQFTTLGILDESEVAAVKAEAPPANPAAAATLAPNPMPAVFAQPTVPANNTPGKPVDAKPAETPAPAPPVSLKEPFLGQQAQIDEAMTKVAAKQAATEPTKTTLTPVESTPSTETSPATEVATPKNTVSLDDVQPETVGEAMAQVAAKAAAKADIQADIQLPTTPATPVESVPSTETKVDPEAAEKAARSKRPRKAKNTVSLDVEPEAVSAPKAVSTPVEAPVKTETVPVQAEPAVPVQANPAPEANPPAAPKANPPAGMPNAEQMDSYRKRIGVFTNQLPASDGMGSVQKMRAFITHMTGAAPQNLTVNQWENQIKWFEDFSTTNGIKGLVKYINDALGVK